MIQSKRATKKCYRSTSRASDAIQRRREAEFCFLSFLFPEGRHRWRQIQYTKRCRPGTESQRTGNVYYRLPTNARLIRYLPFLVCAFRARKPAPVRAG